VTPTPEFHIARYPVTVAQFRAFVQATQFKLGDNDALADPDNRPVRWVSWHEAIAYCEWLGEQLKTAKVFDGTGLADRVRSGGWRVSLPSELEWEKAARASRPDAVFSWGDDPDEDQANYEGTVGDTSTVGCYPPNGYGLSDMIGNVWEWTRSLWGQDWERPDFHYPYDVNDARRENPEAGDDVYRVLRGGSWFVLRPLARCAFRYGLRPLIRNLNVGFRVVLRPSPVQPSDL
ncbi:MAG: SUMF1/EgtB/PvdO family nonheme iron enzyme, partial [Tabrizicola sp.]|nr:SUMF1/EgtB/PvdO family nonheme iron enzyme [Tabrizicola sp.]